MDEQLPTESSPVISLPMNENRGGAGLAVLFAISAAGILLSALIAQVGLWFIGEAVFYGYKIPDLRWLVSLAFSLAVFIPSGILLALVSNRFHKRIYRTLFLAGLYGIILTPVHLADITSAQLTNVLQIGASGIFAAGVWFWLHRRRKVERSFFSRSSASRLTLASAAGVVMGYFWLAWGAFGSPLDILLNVLSGLSLALAAAVIMKFCLFDFPADPSDEFRRRDVLLFGLISSLVLVVLATTFGHNGSQMVLFAVLPVVGWPAAAYLGRSRQESRVWPLLLLVGLTAAWPMMLVDGDELSTVINSGTRELIEVSIRAAGLTAAAGLVIALLSLINPRGIKRLAPWMAAAAIAAGVLIHGLAGNPGFHGEKLFVVMKDQADLHPLADIQPVDERRSRIYETLTRHAETSQSDLRASLEKLNIPYTPYYLVNGLEVDGGALIHWWLETRPDVDRVLASPRLRPLPEEIPAAVGDGPTPGSLLWNLEMVRADEVWQEFGAAGKGVIIGQSDSGVDGSHPELADSYRGRDRGDDFNWFDPWAGTRTPEDLNGHGTHTLGTILGNRVGIAPDAEWIGCANLRRNLGNPAVYLDCMQFMLAPFPQNGDPFKDAVPELGAEVMNNSWGCPVVEGCDAETFHQAVKALRTAGIFVVVSAGNSGDGGCETVTDPLAIYDEVLTVGAVNAFKQRASFSSLGPVTVDGSGRVKPDIMAPGEDVLSAYPGGTYSKASGTSMAGPHLAGVVALIWSANPELAGDIDRTSEILELTAAPMMDVSIDCGGGEAYPNNGTGYGIVDAYEAVKLALEKY